MEEHEGEPILQVSREKPKAVDLCCAAARYVGCPELQLPWPAAALALVVWVVWVWWQAHKHSGGTPSRACCLCLRFRGVDTHTAALPLLSSSHTDPHTNTPPTPHPTRPPAMPTVWLMTAARRRSKSPCNCQVWLDGRVSSVGRCGWGVQLLQCSRCLSPRECLCWREAVSRHTTTLAHSPRSPPHLNTSTPLQTPLHPPRCAHNRGHISAD